MMMDSMAQVQGLITSPRFQDWSPEQPSPSDDLLVQQVGYLPSYAITLPQILPNTLEQSLRLAGSEPGIASSAECFQVEALQDNNVNFVNILNIDGRDGIGTGH
jgi:hypothetical protein